MPSDAKTGFDMLYDIIRRLRAPDGCPWDLQQTPQSLRASLVDEVWECISAIDAGDDRNLEEELGDLYLLVTMIAWMKEQEGAFSVQSSLERIAEKLIRRHPHVFGDTQVAGVAHVLQQWDAIKEREVAPGGDRARAHEAQPAVGVPSAPPSALDRVPKSVPPLEKSNELQKKAAKVGFDWGEPGPVWDKIDEELTELREALTTGDARMIEGEVGDLLFSVVNLSRLLSVDPSVALHGTNGKFERRFREVERRLAAQGLRPKEAGLARMDELWNQIKVEEKRA
jgi:tetrapyrrole methylase family protein / MazG family protein